MCNCLRNAAPPPNKLTLKHYLCLLPFIKLADLLMLRKQHFLFLSPLFHLRMVTQLQSCGPVFLTVVALDFLCLNKSVSCLKQIHFLAFPELLIEFTINMMGLADRKSYSEGTLRANACSTTSSSSKRNYITEGTSACLSFHRVLVICFFLLQFSTSSLQVCREKPDFY